MDEKKLVKQLTRLSNNNTAQTFAFNAQEAEKSRAFSEYMSNTSHQREVADLQAAGLNPVLSANQGATSYTAASASGSSDNSNVNAIAQMIMNSQNNANALKIAKINRQVGLASAAATRYAAGVSAAATEYAAGANYAASVYGSDTSARINAANNATALLTTGMNNATERWKTKHQRPSTWAGLAAGGADIIQHFFGNGKVKTRGEGQQYYR